jgi:hypothetical protein
VATQCRSSRICKGCTATTLAGPAPCAAAVRLGPAMRAPG